MIFCMSILTLFIQEHSYNCCCPQIRHSFRQVYSLFNNLLFCYASFTQNRQHNNHKINIYFNLLLSILQYLSPQNTQMNLQKVKQSQLTSKHFTKVQQQSIISETNASEFDQNFDGKLTQENKANNQDQKEQLLNKQTNQPNKLKIIFKSRQCKIVFALFILTLILLAVQSNWSKLKLLVINLVDTSTCQSLLPYDITNEIQTRSAYYKWWGKVGQNINGQSYLTGHFIERHVAVNGKCTYYQSSQGKTVFYSWYHAFNAFQFTKQSKCQIFDSNTFSYGHTIYLEFPVILGIDCRTRQLKMFSKLFILYRRAIDYSYPTQQQYFSSKNVTIWTFYPMN